MMVTYNFFRACRLGLVKRTSMSISSPKTMILDTALLSIRFSPAPGTVIVFKAFTTSFLFNFIPNGPILCLQIYSNLFGNKSLDFHGRKGRIGIPKKIFKIDDLIIFYGAPLAFKELLHQF